MPRTPAAVAASSTPAPAKRGAVASNKKKTANKKTPARGARILSERAQRISRDPMSGFSSRRMLTMALQHGIYSLSDEAKNTVRSIVNDGVEQVLEKAMVLALSNKKHTMRAQDVETAYAVVSQLSPRIAMAGLTDDRESVARALKNGKMTRRAKHTPETA
jgi:histone H3/H4